MKDLKKDIRAVFVEKGDGYLLAYNVAMDNSLRMKFFRNKEYAKRYAKDELANCEYVGIVGIMKVSDFSEWKF